ncbi:MAG: DUF2490 domain-containing protein [Candidatus Omnitrophica bacterium]|nr:DUF2490 domain-containing protein [Candidatus Omnitrophota bacterium]
MKRVGLLIVGLILVFTVNLYAYDDGDFQIWNTDIEEVQLKKNLKLVFEQEFRWANNASEFYYQHYDAGLAYAFNKTWSVGGGYRQIYARTVHQSWSSESSPYLFFTYSGELAGFKFDDRNRFEYQYYSFQSDTGRYRNKLTVKAPWKFTKLEIQPFISDEFFIMIGNDQGLNQNRLTAGLSFNLTKNLKAELYYMLLSSKSASVWKDYNVLGTKVKVVF